LKSLVIIGARGFGREIVDFSKQCLGFGTDFIIKGFLDDDKNVLDGFENYPPILSSVEDYQLEESDVFITALGSIKWTEFYSNIIIDKRGEFINLIHKNAVLGQNVKLGKGIIIGTGSLISTDVKIADFTQIMSYCVIGHDVKIGMYCRLGDYVFLGGYTIINHFTFLAVRSTVLANIKIGKNVTVGAASVVIRNIRDNISVFGNPAKKIDF
jgi:sugar O-acyltransferase (sialic acid O-acetyltransferase NeuD family)